MASFPTPKPGDISDESPIERLLRRLNQRVVLDEADAAAIRALPVSVKQFEAGQYLVREGNQSRHAFFLLEGFVIRHKYVGVGGRQIIAIHMPGDFMDIQNVLLGHADHNVQALRAATVAAIEVEAMLDLAHDRPRIGLALWRESLIEASIYSEWIANIGRRDARSRIAHLLCELAVRREEAGLGSRDSFELPMTQEQIGDAQGLTAVHVNRTLKALQDESLIHRSKRAIQVANWEGLREVGDFTTGYLHLEALPLAA
ncbi:MAG: Crp/Fnr family transcriptional regulator [Sphingomonadaceae bacterium]|nr:Crp/Fnr family transcriptional regulator [Sphingomonadaceae bacterium]